MKRTPKELAELTIRDIEKRKELRRKGQVDADSYIFDMQEKSFRRNCRIRFKSYRGK